MKPLLATKILLVDDDEVTVRILAHQLESAGYDVVLTHDGEEALNQLMQTPKEFILVIADRVMPKLHGTELALKMQEHSILKNVPVILMTGLADKEEVIEAIKIGVADFLYKPIENDLLLAVVKKHFHKKSE